MSFKDLINLTLNIFTFTHLRTIRIEFVNCLTKMGVKYSYKIKILKDITYSVLKG